MESNNIRLGHLRRPDGRGKDKRVSRPSLLCIYTKFLRLFGRLSSGTGDDHDILEPVGIQSLPRESDSVFTLIMREMLSFAIAALNQDARNAALFAGSANQIVSRLFWGNTRRTWARRRTWATIATSSNSSFWSKKSTAGT